MDKVTEKQNPKSKDLDTLSVNEILTVINNEDKLISQCIESSIPIISELVQSIIDKFYNNGRLFYVGCGTSGRIGVLDAAECPPTFNVSPNLFNGIIAGGRDALVKSIENAEDSINMGKNSIINANINENDVVIGISASSTANFVIGALKESKKRGCLTALITFNKVKQEKYIDYVISTIVGPEIISGSTRMKSGTATKMILNMISTSVMIKMNKTYGNLMVDLKVSNLKLLDRAVRIVSELTGKSYADSENILNEADGNVKIAVVMSKLNKTLEESKKILKSSNGSLRKIIGPS
ncbi:MAG: N-acetylmuramic acid 6-phosphate etherase [Candidatus Marinimicrobia bacterium]|nr:N-acetylmuramic acid 6-phosphate etherase [Candidatus Neomarinimicrobiota bacterium]